MVLSMVLQALRDYEGALTLNQEVIDSYLRRGAEFDPATAYFMRGFIFTELHDFQSALDVLARSRARTPASAICSGAGEGRSSCW